MRALSKGSLTDVSGCRAKGTMIPHSSQAMHSSSLTQVFHIVKEVICIRNVILRSVPCQATTIQT
eukprot:1724834-Amphidinium_carterae.1